MNSHDVSKIDIISDEDISRARHLARGLCKRAGFDDRDETRLVTIVSELSRNIVKYAAHGACEFELVVDARQSRIRCRFRDEGPGIADVEAALTDGYSTGATLGVGLPGAKRLADLFDLTTSTSGTTVEVEVKARAIGQHVMQPGGLKRSSSDDVVPQVGVSIRPFRHGRFSGDQGNVWIDENRITACIIDGLGHGEPAEIASLRALSYLEQNHELEPIELVEGCNAQLQGTRGGAIGLATIDRRSGRMEFVGVGNTRCAIVSSQVTYLGSVYGIVGEGGFKPKLESRQLERRDILMLWTDGLPEAIRMVPSRVRRMTNAQTFANDLIKQYAIDDDDAGVVIVRWGG